MDNHNEDQEQSPSPQIAPLHPYELSPLERNALRNNIETYKNTYIPVNSRDIEKHEAALKEILLTGRRGLPVLKEELYDNENHITLFPEFANIVNVLADKEDVTFVKNVLIDALENRPRNTDTLMQLNYTFLRQILQIRDTDPHDPKLHDIAMSLGSAVASSRDVNEHVRALVGITVVGTGDSWVEDFLEDNQSTFNPDQHETLVNYYNGHHVVDRNDLTDAVWKAKLDEARGGITPESQEYTELTDEEKESIQRNFQIYTQPNMPNTPESRNIREHAYIEILKFKDRALPYLKEILLDNPSSELHDPEFEFSIIADAVGQRQDIPILLDAISHDSIARIEDHSAINTLANVLRRLSVQIRIDNPQDPNLFKIADRLAQLHASSEGTRLYRDTDDIDQVIAATGTDRARQYLDERENRNPRRRLSHLREITNNIQTIRIVHGNAEYIQPSTLQAAGIEAQGDIDLPWVDSFAYSMHDSYSSDLGENIDEEDDDNEYIHDDYDNSQYGNEQLRKDLFLTYRGLSEIELSTLAKHVRDIVRNHMETSRMSDDKAAEGLLTLHMFNSLQENPSMTDVEVDDALHQYDNVLWNEISSESMPDLPSIGIEVEVANELLPTGNRNFQSLRGMLNASNIRVTDEARSTELMIPPTHSVEMQNRILLELRRAGLVPTDKRFASLHINIGTSNIENNYEIAEDLSDLFTIAYVPDGRIASRKHKESVKFDSAMQINNLDETSKRRYEFRTPRIVGPKTYRLLHEMQNIGTFLTTQNAAYDTLLSEFVHDVETLRENHGIPRNAPEYKPKELAEKIKQSWQEWQDIIVDATGHITDDKERKKAIAKIKREEHNNLIMDARVLMHKYSKAVQQIREEEYGRDFHGMDQDYEPLAAD